MKALKDNKEYTIAEEQKHACLLYTSDAADE